MVWNEQDPLVFALFLMFRATNESYGSGKKQPGMLKCLIQHIPVSRTIDQTL